MATTDVHGVLMPFDYVRDIHDPAFGLSKVAHLVDKARAEVPGNLLFDCGDMLEGTALTDLIARPKSKEFDLNGSHLTISVMNTMGYNAMALGNHDFNYGLAFLRKALRSAAFPVLSANLVLRGTAQTAFRGAALLVTRVRDTQGHWHPIKVGVFGVLPPQTVAWDYHHLGASHWVLPIQATAARRARALRAAGADVVVALSHSGISDAAEDLDLGPLTENAALQVAATPEIDAVFCGHTHGLVPGPRYQGLEEVFPDFSATEGRVLNTPIVMAGAAAQGLGIIDLDLRWDKGRWRSVVGRGHVRRVAPSTPAKASVLEQVAPSHLATRSALSAQIGSTDACLHTLFALVGGSRALELVAKVQRQFGEHVRASLPQVADLPLLSASTPFRTIGAGRTTEVTEILPGPVLRRHLYDLYPYPNSFALVEVTGAQLRAWLAESGQIFHQLVRGVKNQPLLRAHVPTYTFDVIYGVQTQFDLALAPTHPNRVAHVTLDGAEIGPDDRVLVATNAYRAGVLRQQGRMQQVLPVPLKSNRDLLEEAFANGLSWPKAPAERPWRFAPMAETAAWFRTSPLAHAYTDEARRLGITLGDYDAEGLLRATVALWDPSETS